MLDCSAVSLQNLLSISLRSYTLRWYHCLCATSNSMSYKHGSAFIHDKGRHIWLSFLFSTCTSIERLLYSDGDIKSQCIILQWFSAIDQFIAILARADFFSLYSHRHVTFTVTFARLVAYYLVRTFHLYTYLITIKKRCETIPHRFCTAAIFVSGVELTT